jgi:hypothetical protein
MLCLSLSLAAARNLKTAITHVRHSNPVHLLTRLPYSVALQGRIASFMCGDEPLGPPRVWLREVNIPGLCMTRSFGDYVAASVGLIDQPQLMAATLKPEDK